MPSIPPLARRLLILLLLLAVGCFLWWWVGDLPNNTLPPVFFGLVTTGVCLLPGIGQPLAAPLERVRRPTPPNRAIAAVAVAIIAMIVLYAAAAIRGRAFFPVTHDEQMYLLQTRMLAHGRLWLPPHPLADFLETFFVLVRPVYAPIYFPGTALLFVPAIWLHVPIWLWALAVTAAATGLLFRVITELIDAVAGALAALLLLSLPAFRGISIFEMSHSVMALLGLALIFAWLKWREHRSSWWAVAIGCAAGWSAITRPADAAVFSGVVGFGIALDLWHRPMREWLRTGAIVVAAAAPFLAVQVVFNLGVTGHPFQTPYARYLAAEQPGIEFALHPRPLPPEAAPSSHLEQKRQYYEQYLRPRIERYRASGLFRQWPLGKFAAFAQYVLPHPGLLVLYAAGLLAVTNRPRRLLWATTPLLALVYSFNPFLLAWYMLSWTAGAILGVLLGVDAIASICRRPAIVSTATSAGIAVVALWALFAPDRTNSELWRAPLMESLHWLDSFHPPKPAVVMFRFTPGMNANQEPVYNLSTPWPDDAWVVRLHDLGPERERDVLVYYAARQPDRELYRLDLASGEFVDVGNVRALLELQPPRR